MGVCAEAAGEGEPGPAGVFCARTDPAGTNPMKNRTLTPKNDSGKIHRRLRSRVLKKLHQRRDVGLARFQRE